MGGTRPKRTYLEGFNAGQEASADMVEKQRQIADAWRREAMEARPYLKVVKEDGAHRLRIDVPGSQFFPSDGDGYVAARTATGGVQ